MRDRLITSALIIFIFFGISLINPGVAWMKQMVDQYNRSSLIRLHVIANSDSVVDQKLKLKVRDRIVKLTSSWLLKVEDRSFAQQVIQSRLTELAQAAHKELVDNGCNKPVKISFGKFAFPEKAYPFGVLPAGEYQGLRLVIGEGKGQNWWCVLYPPLCLLSPDAPGFKTSKQPSQQPSPKVEYRLGILEQWVKNNGLTMDAFWRGWGKVFGLN